MGGGPTQPELIPGAGHRPTAAGRFPPNPDPANLLRPLESFQFAKAG